MFIAGFGGVLALLAYVARKSADAPMLPPPPPIKAESITIPGSGDAKLDALARELDLTRDVDAVRRAGPPKVVVEAKPHGAAEPAQLVLNAEIEIAPPLGLRLKVAPRGIGAYLGLSPTNTVVSEAFDALLDASALHLDQARDLFAGELGDWAEQLARDGVNPRIDDDSLRLSIPGRVSESRVVAAVELAVRLAKALPKARAKLPRPEIEREVLEALRPLALALEGRLDEQRLSIRSQQELATIEVDAQFSEEDGWRTQFSAFFERPLLCEVQVTDRTAHSRWELWRSPDIELGDAPFDQAFVIRGEPEDEVKSALSAAVRQALQKLSELTDAVSMDRSSLSAVVEDLVPDAARGEAIVQALLEVVAPLTARSGGDQGAYR